MIQNSKQPYELKEDEKFTPIMIYTAQKLIWGQLVSKKIIRVSIWLSTEMAPKYLTLNNAQMLLFGAGKNRSTLKFNVINVETSQIGAYHVLPPTDESPYYETDEPNRKMQPITAISGVFRFDASIRIANQSDVITYLSVSKGDFLPVFDAQITCPVLPAIKAIKAPFVLIRQSEATISPQS